MKNTLILALAMVAPVFAGEPSAPVATAAPAVCPLALEFGPTCTLACEDLAPQVEGADMYGLDLTAVYNLTEKWAITLRGGWARGEGDTPWGIDVDVETLSLMPGIRYTSPITEKLSWFAGANAGVTKLKAKTAAASESKSGFSYSVEGGLKYDLCEKTYLYGALNVAGSEASPVNLDDQLGVGLRLGVGFDF